MNIYYSEIKFQICFFISPLSIGHQLLYKTHAWHKTQITNISKSGIFINKSISARINKNWKGNTNQNLQDDSPRDQYCQWKKLPCVQTGTQISWYVWHLQVTSSCYRERKNKSLAPGYKSIRSKQSINEWATSINTW